MGYMGMTFTGVEGVYLAGICNQRLLQTDENGNLLPCLATSWQYSPDYKTLTLTLRQGVKFHDGTPFNAEAGKFDLEMRRDVGKISDVASIASIDTVDNFTIRLNLSKPDPILLRTLGTGGTHITSPTAFKTMGKDWCLTHSVGTGPFKFVSYQRSVSIKFERFDDYWGGQALS